MNKLKGAVLSVEPHSCETSLVDIGVNLTSRQFQGDRDRVVSRALEAGCKKMILTGTSLYHSRESFKICKSYSFSSINARSLYFTAGVHPHNAKECNDSTLSELRALSSEAGHLMVAVGECGLDYDRDFSPREVQNLWFEHQLHLAKELNRPVFLHERKAFPKFSEILYSHVRAGNLPKGGVVHCFTGTREELEFYLEMGLHIGITGWITDERRGKTLQELVKLIPLDRLMIETDAPFLTPWGIPTEAYTEGSKGGKSGKNAIRNEPAYLPFVARKVAECMGISEKELASHTTNNAVKFFGLNESA